MYLSFYLSVCLSIYLSIFFYESEILPLKGFKLILSRCDLQSFIFYLPPLSDFCPLKETLEGPRSPHSVEE